MSGIFSKAVGLNGLSYRLLSYILICSTVLALVITVLQLAWDYNKDVTVIEASIGQIEASFLQPISASLWNLDEEQVKVQIEGIMANRPTCSSSWSRRCWATRKCRC